MYTCICIYHSLSRADTQSSQLLIIVVHCHLSRIPPVTTHWQLLSCTSAHMIIYGCSASTHWYSHSIRSKSTVSAGCSLYCVQTKPMQELCDLPLALTMYVLSNLQLSRFYHLEQPTLASVVAGCWYIVWPGVLNTRLVNTSWNRQTSQRLGNFTVYSPRNIRQ